jgi:peptide-methionine (S)-S-oxide reductase
MSTLFRGESLRVSPAEFPQPEVDLPAKPGETEQTAVFAGGCFWCVEAVYRELAGVHGVVSGYAGGSAATADYDSVCGGDTGHAEAIEVRFDPHRVTYGQLLRIFFAVAHDPTQLNRQGGDVGTQYRSAIFYAGEEQRRVAEAYVEQLERAGVFDGPIATTLEPLGEFYEAEAYHQNYASLHPGQPYIQAVAAPKVSKLCRYFPGLLTGLERREAED